MQRRDRSRRLRTKQRRQPMGLLRRSKIRSHDAERWFDNAGLYWVGIVHGYSAHDRFAAVMYRRLFMLWLLISDAQPYLR